MDVTMGVFPHRGWGAMLFCFSERYKEQELKLSTNDILKGRGNICVALEPLVKLISYKVEYVKGRKEVNQR